MLSAAAMATVIVAAMGGSPCGATGGMPMRGTPARGGGGSIGTVVAVASAVQHPRHGRREGMQGGRRHTSTAVPVDDCPTSCSCSGAVVRHHGHPMTRKASPPPHRFSCGGVWPDE